MADFIGYLTSEWRMISHAPVLIVAWAFVVGVVLFGIMRLFFAVRLNSLHQRLEVSENKVKQYESKLNVATPDEARTQLDKLEERVALMKNRLEAEINRDLMDRFHEALKRERLDAGPF